METLVLEGELTFQTVIKKRDTFLDAITSCKDKSLVFSMKAVTKADSAGLALMLEGARHARAMQVALEFQDIPKQLRQIATFCRVSDLLGFSAQ